MTSSDKWSNTQGNMDWFTRWSTGLLCLERERLYLDSPHTVYWVFVTFQQLCFVYGCFTNPRWFLCPNLTTNNPPAVVIYQMVLFYLQLNCWILNNKLVKCYQCSICIYRLSVGGLSKWSVTWRLLTAKTSTTQNQSVNRENKSLMWKFDSFSA